MKNLYIVLAAVFSIAIACVTVSAADSGDKTACEQLLSVSRIDEYGHKKQIEEIKNNPENAVLQIAEALGYENRRKPSFKNAVYILQYILPKHLKASIAREALNGYPIGDVYSNSLVIVLSKTMEKSDKARIHDEMKKSPNGIAETIAFVIAESKSDIGVEFLHEEAKKITGTWTNIPLVKKTLGDNDVPEPKEDVFNAYKQLASSFTYPKDISPEDAESMRIIKESPESLTDTFVSALIYGNSRESDKNAYYMISLLPRPQMLKIIRRIISSYPIGEASGMVQALAIAGTEEDIPRIRAEMESSPNGAAVGIAIAIAESKNPISMKLLQEVKASNPGAWMDNPLVKTSLEQYSKQEKADGKSTNKEDDIITEMDKHQPKGKKEIVEAKDKYTGNKYKNTGISAIFLIIGGILIILLIIIFVFYKYSLNRSKNS